MTLEPVQLPRTLRQSLLARADACRRSAYLALKYPNQTAHELAFGSAAHAFLERLLSDLIAQGEQSLYAPAEGEDPVAAAREVASLSGAMVDEILREHPEWPVPVAHESHSVDHLREVCYHVAVGLDVDPGSVLGLEQSFELDLECGWTLTGRVDVLTQLRPDTLGVDDAKSSFNVESESAFEALFQMRAYPLLVMFGHPVEFLECEACDGRGEKIYDGEMGVCVSCEGAGGETRRLPALGDGIQFIRSRHLYPRYLDDGTLRERSVILTRQQIQDWRHDVERLAADLVARFGSWDEDAWPAISGSHCNECACQMECPLPAKLREYAGTVNDRDRAGLVLASAERMRAQASAAVKEVRNWAKLNGAVRVGDYEWDWRDTAKWETDWGELEPAIFEAANFGAPFDLGLYRREKVVQSFTKRKLSPDELAAGDEEAHADGDARWGEVPF